MRNLIQFYLAAGKRHIMFAQVAHQVQFHFIFTMIQVSGSSQEVHSIRLTIQMEEVVVLLTLCIVPPRDSME
jgi:hypothetical protein